MKLPRVNRRYQRHLDNASTWNRQSSDSNASKRIIRIARKCGNKKGMFTYHIISSVFDLYFDYGDSGEVIGPVLETQKWQWTVNYSLNQERRLGGEERE